MKIFLLGFLVVALTAAPSDKDKNKGREDETKKSQLDTLLARLRHQEDQLQRLQKEVAHQTIRTKEQELKNEDLQLQLQEQRQEMEDQRQEMEEQRQEMKERLQQQERKNNDQEQQISQLTTVKRERRFDNDTEEHLKELIRAEIHPLIDGLSQCEIGSFYASTILGWTTETVSFGGNFTRTPKVVTSLGRLNPISRIGDVNFNIEVWSPTTTKFDLHYYSKNGFTVSWIACA